MTSLTADRYDNLTAGAFRRLVHALLATDKSLAPDHPPHHPRRW